MQWLCRFAQIQHPKPLERYSFVAIAVPSSISSPVFGSDRRDKFGRKVQLNKQTNDVNLYFELDDEDDDRPAVDKSAQKPNEQLKGDSTSSSDQDSASTSDDDVGTQAKLRDSTKEIHKFDHDSADCTSDALAVIDEAARIKEFDDGDDDLSSVDSDSSETSDSDDLDTYSSSNSDDETPVSD